MARDFGIFGSLSREEEGDVVPGVEAGDITEEIVTDEAVAEVSELETEIATDSDAMAQADVASIELETQITTAEEILANPETVTPEVVEIAAESLRVTARLLGGSIDSRYVVSRESIKASPVVSLEVSVEGAKDFLRKLIESIKAIFRKIMNAGKKLFVKLVVVMDGTAKKAKKLEKVVGKLPSEPTSKFETKEAKAILSRQGAYLALNGGIGGFKYSTKISELITDVTTIKGVVDGAINAVNKIADIKEDTAGAKKKEAAAALEAGTAKLKLLNAATLESNFGYNAPDGKETAVKQGVLKGNTLKIVEVYNTEDEKSVQKIAVKSLTVNKDLFEDASIEVAGKQALVSMIADIVASSKNLSKYSTEAMKAIDAADKALDKLAKDSSGSYVINKLKAGPATAVRDLTVGLMLDGVLGYVTAVKGQMSTVNDCVRKYNTNQM